MIRHLLCAVALLAVSCKTTVPPPEVPGARALTPAEATAAWGRVLDARVDDAGRIDFEGLSATTGDLDTYVAWLAAAGPDTRPELFPAPEHVLAYYADAYNALAMYNVIHSGVLPKNKVRFFWARRLTLDGREISLYDLENDVIRPLGEARMHFALNCMVRGCPRLPREPFSAGDLDAVLDAAAREFFADPKHVRVEEERVLFSSILKWYDEDFLAEAPSLIAYANRYREEPIPEDLEVGFLDYDWSLNEP